MSIELKKIRKDKVDEIYEKISDQVDKTGTFICQMADIWIVLNPCHAMGNWSSSILILRNMKK